MESRALRSLRTDPLLSAPGTEQVETRGIFGFENGAKSLKHHKDKKEYQLFCVEEKTTQLWEKC